MIFHNAVFYSYSTALKVQAPSRLCNNSHALLSKIAVATAMLDIRASQWKRVLLWLILAGLAALVAIFGIRGYLSPEMLFGFSNSFSC